ncbi:MAG: serine/threonine protein kinase [Deltaproteobacteria bacterium]|nr:serine/threonine protein kinase [Deltaproteobacteria bacterium]
MVEVYHKNPTQGSLFAGRYQVEKLLGEGAMGRVFLARDTMLSNERVALKVLHQSLCADARHTKRFLREIQLTRKITHPNIVRTFEIGSQGGWLFFSMEYAPGKTLKEMISEGQVELGKVKDILLEIACGLQAIHEAGIIHRDLKPGNVICSPDYKIKITDFGIARPDASDLTGHDELLGSIRYLAPECWTGTNVGPPADMYALGVVGYELFTGIVPFDGEGAAELMFKHLQIKPLRPSALLDRVPHWADELVMNLLEKDPAKRFGTDQLIALLSGDGDLEEKMRSYSSNDSVGRKFGFEAPDYSFPPNETAGVAESEDDWLPESPLSEENLGSTDLPLIEDPDRYSWVTDKKLHSTPSIESRLFQHSGGHVFGSGAHATPDGMGAHLLRLLLAPGLFVVVGIPLAVPLAFLARTLWGWREEEGVIFALAALLVLLLYALIAAIPLTCLGAIALPVRKLPRVWLKIGVALMPTVTIMALVYTGWSILVGGGGEDGLELSKLLYAWQEGVRAVIDNLFRVTGIFPYGSHYYATLGQNGAALAVGGSWGGLLLYYVLLVAYLRSVISAYSEGLCQHPREKRRLIRLIVALTVVCLLEFGARQYLGPSEAWRSAASQVVSAAGSDIDSYAITCGLMNWALLILGFFLFDQLRRRSNE